MKLPENYLKYLRSGKPHEGELTIDPLWFDLWQESEIHNYNFMYQVEFLVSDFYGFGSNGNNEMLAFDSSGQVFTLPFIGMSKGDAIKVASSWEEFESKIKID